MAKKSLKCAKCSRAFSMPAHLARHMNTIHRASAGRPAGKKRIAASAKAARKRPRATARGRTSWGAAPAASAQLGTGVAARLVGDMQSYLGELQRQREALDAEVSAISGALVALGNPRMARSPDAPRRGRPPGSGGRPGSLKSFIVRVLRQRSRPMSPRDIAAAVAKTGYKSKAKDLTKAVSNSLPELKSIKKVGFGMYKL